MRTLLYLVFLLDSLALCAKDPYIKNEAIDIQHYRFQLSLNDTTDVIAGKAIITILFRKDITEFDLDLVNKNVLGAGMQISQVQLNGTLLRFLHKNDKLRIYLPAQSTRGQTLQLSIEYGGVPQDGLIISKNKFGDRTFFGDNWPDRAHHWLPTLDHPSDKATCEFIVIAPSHYQVIGNGKKTEEINLPKNQKMTHWEEAIDIPTKVMVIGAARFAIQEAGRVNDIPVESWVYPQNQEEGFSDYACAVKILDFFQRLIGPYPYEKLANVQSKTRYGGMENASNIFYAENSVDGKNDHEELIAHEIAHQWFGNSATEKDWHHVWLSEGFASYFSHIYMRSGYGPEHMAEEMQADRKLVIKYSANHPGPIIDTTVVDLMKLLNPHSYQKGSWVLHMLHHEIGDEAFWNGIKDYYQRYHNGNALTSGFQQTMERASHRDLTVFFNQWLWSGGHPRLQGHWKFDAKSKSLVVDIQQVQGGKIFVAPLDIGIRRADGSLDIKTVTIGAKSQEFSFQVENAPSGVVADPQTWLLFEGEINNP